MATLTHLSHRRLAIDKLDKSIVNLSARINASTYELLVLIRRSTINRSRTMQILSGPKDIRDCESCQKTLTKGADWGISHGARW